MRSKHLKLAKVLMDAPFYALVVIRRGIIEHVQSDYDQDVLVNAGTKLGQTGRYRSDEDEIVIWESNTDPEKSCQVWHFEE